MKIDIQEIGTNEKQVNMVLESADFAPEMNKRLKELRSKTEIKGFRKGKTPMSFVKRHYGKKVALDVISEESNEALKKVIQENEFKLINDPVLIESKIPALEDGKLDEECSFSYLLGLTPEFELKGMSKDDSYDFYVLDVEDEKVNERLENLQKQLGEHIHPDDVEKNDVVEIEALELVGDVLKPDGLETTFKFAVDLVANDDLQKKILESKVGDKFDFNIRNIERDRPDEYIRSYFLNIEDNDSIIPENFRATIQSVHRRVPAELNDEFFEKAFPPEVTNEEDAKAAIRDQYREGYMSVGDHLFLKSFMNTLMETNSIDLPEKYTHELYHMAGHHGHDEEAMNTFKEEVRRQILLSHIISSNEIKIEYDDLRSKVMEEFMSNFGGAGMDLPEDTINKIVQNALQNKEYVDRLSDRILNDKLIAAAKEAVTLNEIAEKEEDLMKRFDEAFPQPAEEEE